MADDLLPGDRVEYIGAPVFDGLIETGELGWVIAKAERGWVRASWPRSGFHSVPVDHIRLLPPAVTREVAREANARLWDLLGEELPPRSAGRHREPYMSQGSHPDQVARVWDELGAALPYDCRALAKGGKPVLAHPETDRIFALPQGTAYALWLTPADFAHAIGVGAETSHTWSGGSVTDLAREAGPGWIWGRWFDDEPAWVRRACEASGDR